MWQPDPGRGDPIGWIDGVPIYADGSRGRRVDDHEARDAIARAGRSGFDHGPGSGDARGFTHAASQDPAGAPTFDSMVQYDNSSGRKAKSSLRLIVPVISIAALIMSGIVGLVADGVDSAREFAERAQEPFSSTTSTPFAGSGDDDVVTARGRYTAQVIAVAGRVVTLRRPDGSGVDVLFIAEPRSPSATVLRERAGEWTMVTWEQRGGQLFAVRAIPAEPGPAGTPPPA